MKIMVTGGAGFIGSHLVDQLIQQKHRVIVIDDLSTGKKKFINQQSKFYKIDIRSSRLHSIFIKEQPEIVFHLAAQKSVSFSLKNPLIDSQINILGSLNVIENSLKLKVKKFIFSSTGGAIYGQTTDLPAAEITPANPDSPYGLAKLSIDNFLQNYYFIIKKLKYISLRLANVYGPRQDPLGEAGAIAIFVNNLLKNKQCYINGSGKQTRDFIYVSDVVGAFIKSLNKGLGIYNIGTGKETTVNQLYQLIARIINSLKTARHQTAIPGEVYRSVLKINKAKRELNWQPQLSLLAGVKKTINYFKLYE